MYSCSGILKRCFNRKADSSEALTDFEHLSRSLSQQVCNTIFMDQVVYPLEDRQDILLLLQSHISYNLIKIAKKYYRQRVGIPQGSVLSTILCSMYYADMEKKELDYLSTPDSLLLRYVDDFLLITTRKEKAARFMTDMKRGFPDSGCFINLEKCFANFKIRIDDIPVKYVTQEYFPWCGYLIHMKTLEIQSDYSRLLQGRLSDSLNIEWNHHPGRQFRQKMIQSIKIKLHPIFLNNTLNSMKTMYTNIYMNFRCTAIKFMAYLLELENIQFVISIDFLFKVIEEIIYLVISQVKRFVKENANHPCFIQWCGYHAFKIELSRKCHFKNSSSWQQLKHLQEKIHYHLKKCKSSGILYQIVNECEWFKKCEL